MSDSEDDLLFEKRREAVLEEGVDLYELQPDEVTGRKFEHGLDDVD